MKKILIICFLALPFFVLAQSRQTEVEYQKQLRPAIVNDIPFPQSTIEDAIKDHFTKMGYKATSSKGFLIFKGVGMKDWGAGTFDLYFMADKKSRKEKDLSTVTMMLSKGFDEFVSNSSDAAVFGKAQSYLDSLRNMIAVYDLEQQIIAQENEVKKAVKKTADLEDEAKDLEKKKRKLEDDIADNKKAQEKQAKELENQKQILDVLINKRKQ